MSIIFTSSLWNKHKRFQWVISFLGSKLGNRPSKFQERKLINILWTRPCSVFYLSTYKILLCITREVKKGFSYSHLINLKDEKPHIPTTPYTFSLVRDPHSYTTSSLYMSLSRKRDLYILTKDPRLVKMEKKKERRRECT